MGRLYRKLHRTLGAPSQGAQLFGVVVVLVLLALMAVLILMAPRIANVWLPLLQFAVLPMMLVGTLLWAGKTRRRKRLAAAAMDEAAKEDGFWQPGKAMEALDSLFEPYWLAVRAQDASAVAERLSAHWKKSVDEAFTLWREQGLKPVLFELRLLGADIVGMEDWVDNRRDQVAILVRCQTSFHLVDTRTGMEVEGNPGREERQLWRFVRGGSRWLLNRVDIVEGMAALETCRVLREVEAAK